MKIGKKIISWDTVAIADNQAEYIVNNPSEFENIQDDDGTISIEAARDYAYEDYDLFGFEWNYMCDYLDEVIQKKNKEGYWKATVNNFGWRNQDGVKYFEADNGKDLLQNILPDTDCTFHIFNYGKGLAIQNYHHDSPMGNEWYYILPVAYSTYEKTDR